MTIYVTPPNERPGDVLYAFMSEDENGNRGIVGCILPGVGSTPLVTLSPNGVDLMRPHAADAARKTGRKVVLVSYKIDSIQTVDPSGAGG